MYITDSLLPKIDHAKLTFYVRFLERRLELGHFGSGRRHRRCGDRRDDRGRHRLGGGAGGVEVAGGGIFGGGGHLSRRRRRCRPDSSGIGSSRPRKKNREN